MVQFCSRNHGIRNDYTFYQNKRSYTCRGHESYRCFPTENHRTVYKLTSLYFLPHPHPLVRVIFIIVNTAADQNKSSSRFQFNSELVEREYRMKVSPTDPSPRHRDVHRVFFFLNYSFLNRPPSSQSHHIFHSSRKNHPSSGTWTTCFVSRRDKTSVVQYHASNCRIALG